MSSQKGVLEEKETGTSEVIFKNSGLVAPTGIELYMSNYNGFSGIKSLGEHLNNFANSFK